MPIIKKLIPEASRRSLNIFGWSDLRKRMLSLKSSFMILMTFDSLCVFTHSSFIKHSKKAVIKKQTDVTASTGRMPKAV